MTEYWFGYWGIELLPAVNAQQRETLKDAVFAFYTDRQVNTRQPAELFNHRVNLDGTAAIFKSKFNTDLLTVDQFKQFLGNTFSIDPETIDHDTRQTQYGPVITLSRNGTDYLRVALFGGVGSTYAESHDAAYNYVHTNLSGWETE